MGFPSTSSSLLNYDLAESFDPRVTATDAPAGTLFRYIPKTGPVILLQKQDNGKTTNWTAVGGGGGSGDPDTIAYFDHVTGLLTDNLEFRFNAVHHSFQCATSVGGGVLDSSGAGSGLFGQAEGPITPGNPPAAIHSSGVGSFASGNASAGGQILSVGLATFATGFVYGYDTTNHLPSRLMSAGNGSFANGFILCSTDAFHGDILSVGIGSIASGMVENNANITSIGTGALAGGTAQGDGVNPLTAPSQIQALGAGSIAYGTANLGAQILASAIGSVAMGFAGNGLGQLTSYGTGAFAMGAVGTSASNNSTLLSAVGIGSFAFGSVDGNNSQMLANNYGSFALGTVLSGFLITSSGISSFAGGHTLIGSVTAAGRCSFAYGDDLNNTADLATTFGLGNHVDSYGSLVVGRYASSFGFTAAAWVATDPLIIAGNGTGFGTEANAYRLDKDGKITETAAIKVPVRAIAGNAVASARTDRKFILNDGSAGAYTLTLPAGEEGLYYGFGSAAANTSHWTLTPVGIDTVDGSITTIGVGGVANGGFIFHAGVWYSCN
jgi:hypothetical protein